jgi:uroporphyrinogen-III synthase
MLVINTRPSPDADAFSDAIRACGAAVILSPVMKIDFRGGAAPVAPGEALAFTSANGVRAFARANADRAAPVFAVGAATADEARRAGFISVRAAEGDVESLADLISKTKGTTAVLHLAGSDRAGDLFAALADRGVAARRLVLYDAVPEAQMSAAARAALSESPADCAVGLFSPRSAALFFAQAGRAGLEDRLSMATLLAFSDAVAAAALPDRWGRVKIARERTLGAMAALISA